MEPDISRYYFFHTLEDIDDALGLKKKAFVTPEEIEAFASHKGLYDRAGALKSQKVIHAAPAK
jgi:hypothetical protein